jgi:hypothetical protein
MEEATAGRAVMAIAGPAATAALASVRDGEGKCFTPGVPLATVDDKGGARPP